MYVTVPRDTDRRVPGPTQRDVCRLRRSGHRLSHLVKNVFESASRNGMGVFESASRHGMGVSGSASRHGMGIFESASLYDMGVFESASCHDM